MSGPRKKESVTTGISVMAHQIHETMALIAIASAMVRAISTAAAPRSIA
jgi:hypothetical protein